MAPQPQPRKNRRSSADLENLPRSPALSHLYKAAETAAPPNHPPLSLYGPSALWGWVKNYLAYLAKDKHDFPPYWMSPCNALYDLHDESGADSSVRVSIAGDWGTGTDEAAAVATRIEEFDPHFTIHLGDVYYVGDPPEINENCLGVKNPNNNYDAVKWPIGSRGSFSLNGNHEMYANGTGYFEVLLPRLGLKGTKSEMLGQQTSFFCLQNQYWRIIAIDTGYNSTGVPILNFIPGINKIPGIGPSCKLEQEQIDWLTGHVAADGDKRGIILLSHHQYYSAFDDRYRKPAKQLWDAGVKRPVLWFWGHEHRLAGYDLFGDDDLKAFGRCIGHSGMPLETNEMKHDPAPRFYDKRAGAGFGVNGHVNLTFEGPLVKTAYVDLNNNTLLTEQWSVNTNGAVQLDSITRVTTDSDFIFSQDMVRSTSA